MCGIAGFVGEDRECIERMVAALVHRGPDGNATLIRHGVSLGHTRLAILDPSPLGNQPMWNESKTIVIVYNGEIFNFKDLQRSHDFHCKSGTDTEVILKLYEKYGIECIKMLRGMFAFGIYDTQKREWILARDSSGIKPLFIAYPQGKLHFASEMRALMKALPKKPELNFHALSLYLRLQYVPGPQTMCEGIESLPPGSILTWSEERGEKRRTFVPEVDTISFTSKADFQTTFPSLMDQVVKDHLISDKPIGIFLSGGMDSSILLHHMCNHTQKPVKTFTVRFDVSTEEDADRFNADAEVAKETAKYYGTEHQEIVLSAEICRDVYRDSARALDQPNADSVAMAQFVLASEAKKHVDVVLCGSGGDELFGGYPRYRIARVLHALRYTPSSIRSIIGNLTGYPKDVLRMQPGALLAERLLARPNNELSSIVKNDWFDESDVTKLFCERYSMLDNKDPVRSFMEFDRHLWLVDESLRLGDAITMASGLECRVPFLDPRIIGASHGTKANWHVGLQTTKKLLKETYYPILPSSIRRIKKASFYPPLAKWFRRECAPLVEETLEHPEIQKLFDAAVVRKVYEDHKEHRKYGLHTLSTLTQLRCWFDTVYDV